MRPITARTVRHYLITFGAGGLTALLLMLVTGHAKADDSVLLPTPPIGTQQL